MVLVGRCRRDLAAVIVFSVAAARGGGGGRERSPLPQNFGEGAAPLQRIFDVHVDLATHVVYTLRVDAADTAVQSYVEW